jgi:hypothetical protein
MNKIKYVVMFFGLYACNNDPAPIVPPPAPVATAATDITGDSFMANWEASIGANGYVIEVASDAAFSDTVDLQLSVALGSTLVDSLNSNTEYFYRVRATIDGDHASENSNVISLITLPAAPVALPSSNSNSGGFTANWRAVPEATSYLLYISEEDFPADPPNNLPNYNGLELTDTTYVVTGLNSGAIYYYVIKSKIGNRISEESNSITARTKP